VFLGEQDQYSNIHMSVFRIDPGTGALTQTDRVLVANESTTYAPGCIVTSQSGKYVYFGYDGNNAPNWISAFALDAANGTVSEVAGSPFSAPSIAMGLMPGMATVGNLLYTLNTDQTISGFAINPQTGALAQVSGSPFADPLVASMTIDTVHNLLFTSNSSGAFTCSQSSINSFGINLSSGKLTRIATSGTAGLSCPNPIVADPSGKFVYVGGLVMQAPNCEFDQCYGATSSFLVDPTTGKLTAVTKGLPYPGDPVDDNFVLTLGR
jgi:6-phosphogluconolactonase (cycloisomerase 2 family)